MPVHRVPTAVGDLESAVKAIEKTEEIVSAVPSGDGAVTIFTRKRPTRETR